MSRIGCRMNTLSCLVLILVVLQFVLIQLCASDICDSCTCTENECDLDSNEVCSHSPQDFYVCDGTADKWTKLNQTFDLDSVLWPRRNATASATFNNFKFTYLSNALCSVSSPMLAPTLTSINLESNNIEFITRDPFQYCWNLTDLSLAINRINRLTSDLFESMHSLRRLNLSHNALLEFDGSTLSQCKQLIELDLSHNQITTLKVNEILNASPNIESINVANNLLFAITDDKRNRYLRLKYFNLSGNKMTVITTNTFSSYPDIEFLDMSSNVLSNIENDAFHALHRLRSLDLSRNHLKDLSLKLPENMEYISLAENDIEYWPIDRLPTRLRVLQLQSNRLVGMLKSSDQQYTEVPLLQLLNISHNHIEAFPSMIRFPRLKTLDASYNAFRQVPRDLGEQVPDIDSFIFRGNPIETIEFGARILAHTVDFSESTKLRRMNASNFAAVSSRNSCIRIIVSHSPLLSRIDGAFVKVANLCHLDLSYNNLQHIDHNWVNWSSLYEGVDLQGNPIQCECSSQWMIDFLIPQLHVNHEFHRYLLELRCAAPDSFKSHRLLRYLGQHDVFCGSVKKIDYFRLFNQNRPDADDYVDDYPFSGIQFWIIVALLVLITILSIAIVIALMRRRRQWHEIRESNNRRYHDGLL